MSVDTSVTLPDQPTIGESKFVPLAGNGYTAPQSAYAVSVQMNGDASGGAATITVRPDPQYASIVSFVGGGAFSNAASIGMLFQVFNGTETASAIITPTHEVFGGINPSAAATWSPPLIVLDPPQGDPSIVVVMPNENGVTFTSSLRVYNFRKGVQNVTPLPLLVSALPRSVSSAP